jgi:hypothetical protein
MRHPKIPAIASSKAIAAKIPIALQRLHIACGGIDFVSGAVIGGITGAFTGICEIETHSS